MNALKRSYRIFAVPLFEDNYSYVVQGTEKGRLVLVDPANPTVVLSFLKTNFPQYLVSHVLYTHKHWDHAGESLELYKELVTGNPDVRVVIGQHDKAFVEGANYSLGIDEDLSIGQSKVKTLHVPCHTKGHTIYSFLPLENEHSQNHKIAQETTVEGKRVGVFESQSCTFTGDTLFIGGIGRFFEGNAAQMVGNIRKMYERIDETSHIYCGHEYTLANLKWACQVQKENQEMANFTTKIQKRQDDSGGTFTIPSTLQQQRQINLFVRSVTGTPLLTLANNDSVELMKTLREMKNKNATSFPSAQKSSL